jgi:hypothetical protein
MVMENYISNTFSSGLQSLITCDGMEFFISWEKVDEALQKLAEQVSRGFAPDFIVGVARGGLVPAVRLSHMLGKKEFRTIHVKYYKGRKRLARPKLISDVGPLKGKVLVVDDVSDTGESLKFVVDRLEKRGAEVRVATIACKPCSKFKPDYFAFKTEKWIVFPWEVKGSRGHRGR